MKNFILIPSILIWFFTFGVSTLFAKTLSGSQWRIDVSDGHQYVFKFLFDGTCIYTQLKSPSGNEGKIYANCTWKQNDKVILIEVNNYFAVYSGIIRQGKIKGVMVTNYRGKINAIEGHRLP